MDLADQFNKMLGINGGKKITMEFSVDELAFIAGAMKGIAANNQKRFAKMCGRMGQIQAGAILLRLTSKCEKDFMERREELQEEMKERGIVLDK